MADAITSMTKTKGSHCPTGELRRSRLGPHIFHAYKWARFRKISLGILKRVEGGQFYSATLRQILKHYHGVQVGAYSYGECMVPGSWPAGVSVGRYVSVAPDVRIFLRNHPCERLSMHPFFYNSQLGWVEQDTIGSGTLTIEHDAWIGERAIITPSCRRIGLGAVVGAGSVVTKDVPDFAIVAGNPAKILRFRFSEELCEVVRQSKWWEQSVEQCAKFLAEMVKPLGTNEWRPPSLPAHLHRNY
jgi:virginiamycin A acetyltransferase